MSIFKLGTVVMTASVSRKMSTPGFREFVCKCLQRHSLGDWGNLCESDMKMNDEALAYEMKGEETERLFSSYSSKMFGTIWIITEYDRSATTILLPEEY